MPSNMYTLYAKRFDHAFDYTHLKEKRKWHPLVIAVKYFFLIIIAKSTLGNFGSNMFTYGYQNIFLVI